MTITSWRTKCAIYLAVFIYKCQRVLIVAELWIKTMHGSHEKRLVEFIHILNSQSLKVPTDICTAIKQSKAKVGNLTTKLLHSRHTHCTHTHIVLTQEPCSCFLHYPSCPTSRCHILQLHLSTTCTYSYQNALAEKRRSGMSVEVLDNIFKLKNNMTGWGELCQSQAGTHFPLAQATVEFKHVRTPKLNLMWGKGGGFHLEGHCWASRDLLGCPDPNVLSQWIAFLFVCPQTGQCEAVHRLFTPKVSLSFTGAVHTAMCARDYGHGASRVS